MHSIHSIPRITLASVVLVGLLWVPALHGVPTGDAGKEMPEAAEACLSSLSADQRATASFAFGDDERLDWHFIPRQRRGLSFRGMDEGQRELVWSLLDTGLSAQGIRKVRIQDTHELSGARSQERVEDTQHFAG